MRGKKLPGMYQGRQASSSLRYSNDLDCDTTYSAHHTILHIILFPQHPAGVTVAGSVTMATTVILGTGIIGTSTAYYLSKHQPASSIHLVEPSPELFASASGFAGGFLAKDWFSPASAELGALSFEEHRKLAEKEDGRNRWGYAASTSVSLSPPTDKKRVDVWCRVGASRAEAASGATTAGVAPEWLDGKGLVVEVISDEGTAAQVDPLQLSQFLLQKCLDAGVRLHHPAKAISIQTDVRNEVSSICIADTQSSTETDIPCTNIVIAAGAWSPQVFATLFPTSGFKLPVTSLAGHSLVVKSPKWTKEHEDQGCHAVFMESQPGYCPEIFSRVGGHIYVAGLNSATEPLPALATDSKSNISRPAIEKLRETAKKVLGEDEVEVVREALCFRPATDRGTPILGRIPDSCLGPATNTRPSPEGGVYLAAGHGPWGISMSLGTGKVMAEMIQGRGLSADVSGLGLDV
ncbi:FAD dependent oxidoreductase [Annulohypoxylon maeteangense]|uniref:FAD dependent oxidoreductase n=1 Tax=Annulohypoxylon maeteangense TaxID=1927788 RepID=UPI0020086700|nr:FAD dependent oxidoreductase [Annulohypoxylon maeteangense]KAI0883856.1 FAD dependent oxidoreductase [Annulohypoxylon maeteangense]